MIRSRLHDRRTFWDQTAQAHTQFAVESKESSTQWGKGMFERPE